MSGNHWPREAFIGGEWRAVSRTFAVKNPATGEELAQVADCGAAEARAAVDAAVRGFVAWKSAHGEERARILRRWGELLAEHREPLARTMTQEMGKPITESRGEVRVSAAFVDFYADAARRIGGEIVAAPFAHKRMLVCHEPVGPVYAVTPWNFPAAMVARKVAPALAAGCTVVLKPAEQSPLTALMLARRWEEAGGPPGTLSVLPALDPVLVTRPILDDPRVRKLTFTGSVEVGRMLYGEAAGTMKRVSLELGGNAPFLVFADADLDLAAREIVGSRFRNSGQTCVCTNRVLAHEPVRVALTERLVALTRELRVGDPLQEQTQIGPLVDRAGFEKVCACVEDAVARGASVAVGGEGRGGLFYAPTVLVGARPGMRVVEEESFGPVAPVVSFRDEAEAVALANATSYGLAAYLATTNLARAFRVAEALEYGIVGVNDGTPSAMAIQMPFGGWKDSGIGREGGQWGVEEFLQTKLISLGLDPGQG